MNISLDSEQLKSLVSEAIFKSLDEEKRNALVQGAIAHLLTPASTGYGRAKSPIEDAFMYGVQAVATRIATEILENDEKVKEKIRDLLNESLVRVMETNREETIRKLADNITRGMAFDPNR